VGLGAARRSLFPSLSTALPLILSTICLTARRYAIFFNAWYERARDDLRHGAVVWLTTWCDICVYMTGALLYSATLPACREEPHILSLPAGTGQRAGVTGLWHLQHICLRYHSASTLYFPATFCFFLHAHALLRNRTRGLRRCAQTYNAQHIVSK